MAIVYLHRSSECNQVFYIGIGKDNKRAYYRHGRSKYWKNCVEKHGLNVEITHHDICWQEACRIEQYLISFWRENSRLKICNLTDGGDGVLGLKVSEERKKRYSDVFSGKNNPFYGKKHSELSRLKISNNQNPRKFITDEHKLKISKSNSGKKRSEDVKAKISNSKKGKTAHNKGKKLSEETKNKIREKVKLLYTDEYRKMISDKTKKAFEDNPSFKIKISEKAKGRPSPRKGVKLSNEQKKKLSEINIGKIISEEQKTKVSLFHKGRKRSEETRKNISDAIKEYHKKKNL